MSASDAGGVHLVGDQAVSRFVGLSTFLHAPYQPDLQGIDIALAGIPYDFQSGRGSARLGPSQVREMSRLVRQITMGGVAPFELCRIADVGDSATNPMDPRKSVELATEFVTRIADTGATVVAVGGDHGATYPILKGLVRNGPVGLIHFDAHPDTYDDPFGGFVTHGNAIRLAIEDGIVDPTRTISLGIHGSRFIKTDRDYHADHGMRLVTIDEFTQLGVEGTLEEVRRVVGEGPTYITVDVDVLDTPFAMGTGSPEPGGFSMREILNLLRGMHGLDIIGGDVMEVAPPFDSDGQTALCAANIMHEIVAATALAIDRRRESLVDAATTAASGAQ
ncbi:arginase family protein [Streptomyces hygroscopicus]|uniref:arginase family protein n=1 Tax=Streptomyces hygroscopicus TaxID=1912 RepID=UPI0036338297